MKTKEVLVEVLRWVLVIPAGLAAYAVSIVALRYLIPMVVYEDWLATIVGHLVSPAACPMFMLSAAMYTAPRHKFAVCLILTILHAIGIAFITAWCLSLENPSNPKWEIVLSGVLGIGGTVASCLIAHKNPMLE